MNDSLAMPVRRLQAFAAHHRIALALAGGLLGAAVIAGSFMVYRAHESSRQRDERLAAEQCAKVRTEVDARRYGRANEHILNGRAALGRLSDPSVTARVECMRAEAAMAVVGRHFDVALENLQRARALLEGADEARGREYEAVLAELGGVHFRTGGFRTALELNQQTIEAMEREGRGDTLERVRLAMDHASILERLGEVQRSQAVGFEAMQRLQSLREPPATAALKITYAITLNRLGRTSEAGDLLSTALEEARKTDDAGSVALASYHLGRSSLLEGRLDAAQARLEEARRTWATNETANRERLADLSRSLAEIELARGRFDTARENIDASLVLFDYPRSDALVPGVAAALSTASRIYLQSRQLERAEVFGRAALRIAEATARDPSQSADVGEALLAVAAVRRAKDDDAGARALLGRAVEALSNGLGPDHRLTLEAIRSQKQAQ